MSNNARVSDITIGMGSHGKKCCPHSITGIIVSGRTNVLINNLPAATQTSIGIHTCPHCGVNMVIGSSSTVYAASLGVARIGDPVTEFCGAGIIVSSSNNVISG